MVVFDWACARVGDIANIVAIMVCRSDDGGFSLMQTADRRSQKFVMTGQLPKGASHVTIVNGVVDQTEPVPVLKMVPGTRVEGLSPCTPAALHQVTELCSGFGGFTSEFHRINLHTKLAVDQNKVWEGLFKELHGHSQPVFLNASAGSPVTINKMLDMNLQQGIVVAGVSCQPFSQLGDQAGMDDTRATSIHEVLKTAWATQASAIMLECVPPVLRNQQFQATLKSFCQATGYFLSQRLVDLKNGWCARRQRWFAVLTAPALGPCPLEEFPTDPEHQVISSVLPHVQGWSPGEMQQLTLDLYELQKYEDYAVGGVKAAYLQMEGFLPTTLHSLSNQLTPCACGCRGPLSLHRLEEKGLIGVLVPMGEMIKHGDHFLQTARYPHPAEIFLMNGGDPCHDWQGNMRLAVGGVGQCVSPMIGLWIGAQLKQVIDKFTFQPRHCDPIGVVEAFKEYLLDCRWNIWTPPTPAQEPVHTHGMLSVEIPGAAKVSVAINSPCTVGQIRSAECQFDPKVASFTACTGSLLDLPDTHVLDMNDDLRFCIPAVPASGVHASVSHDHDHAPPPMVWETSDDESGTVGEPTIDDHAVDDSGTTAILTDSVDDPVLALDARGLVRVLPPMVASERTLQMMRDKVIGRQERLQVLATQDGLWGDDEVLFALGEIQAEAPYEQHVVVWDPVQVTSVVRDEREHELQSEIASLPPRATIVTAVLHDMHWIPVVWRIEADQVRAYVSTNGQLPAGLGRLHARIAAHRNALHEPMVLSLPGFEMPTHCGAWVVCFARNLIAACQMPQNMLELATQSQAYKARFTAGLNEQTSRPWIWGRGDNPKHKLETLLQEHGVPLEEVSNRVTHLFERLGEHRVLQAVESRHAWKDLKAIGNMAQPRVQLVKPGELQAVIDAKARKGQVGNRAQKASKGKGKGKHQSMALDPALLKFDDTVFQSGANQSLPQLELAQISGSAAGVVLATPASAAPYLQSTQKISVSSLAIVVLCVESALPQTVIEPQKVTFPVACRANDEPMIVTGFLFQLGAIKVCRADATAKHSIKAIDSCVVKVLLYRDQIQESWDNIVADPMKAIEDRLPILQTCADPGCQGLCECWHVGLTGDLTEPILERWGKQWLSTGFQFVQPSVADIFAIHIRLPLALQTQIHTYSGQSGVYTEPRSVDGRGPSSAFQVVWLPKMGMQEVSMLRQTRHGVLGVARIGPKLGLRCRSEHAEALFEELRPGSTYLPSGQKQEWVIGPFPYGTLRGSLAAALKSMGWQARPVRALPAGPGVPGILFQVQSIAPPPQHHVAMEHGDVVITRVEEPKPAHQETVQVVASARTLAVVNGANPPVDMLQVNDPWARKAPPGLGSSGSDGGTDALEQLQSKITKDVMSQIEKKMEVDEESAASSSRVQRLEEQMQEIHQKQAALDDTMQKQAADTSLGFQRLQAHFQTQHNALEATVKGTVSTFQEQLEAQNKRQETMLNHMFSQQMEHFDAMMAKHRKIG